MEIRRQYYTEEFKQEVVTLVKESGLSIAEAGRRSSRSVTELETENSRLRKELADSRLEDKIIKKAMAYYAKELLSGTRR